MFINPMLFILTSIPVCPTAADSQWEGEVEKRAGWGEPRVQSCREGIKAGGGVGSVGGKEV